MTLAQAKTFSMRILDRWREIQSKSSPMPVYLVRDRRDNQAIAFHNHDHVKRFAESQINREYYSVTIIVGGAMATRPL